VAELGEPPGGHGDPSEIVSMATRRDGFIYRSDGLHVATLPELAEAGRSLAEHPGARRWVTALEGLANSAREAASKSEALEP